MTYSLLTPISPKVEIINGRVVTTSLAIAEYFGKRHDNVLRDIRNAEVPDSFRVLNFEESSYLNQQSKKQPMYHVTKDGFIFLVMGFTGREAAQIKVAYITAFNQMEAQLRQMSSPVTTNSSEYLSLLEKHVALQEKMLQAYESQLQPKPKRAAPHRLTNEAIRQIRSLHEQGFSQADIARMTSYSTATVSFVVRQGVSDE